MDRIELSPRVLETPVLPLHHTTLSAVLMTQSRSPTGARYLFVQTLWRAFVAGVGFAPTISGL